MRLRRLEIIVIGVTLAFVFFMGGFFTGRNSNPINVVQTSAASGGQPQATSVSVQTHETTQTTQTAQATASSDIIAENPGIELRPENISDNIPVGAPRGGDGKININLASQSELTDLPGIGSTLAARIVDYRRQHGDFSRIEDIRNVSGIGEKRYEAIEDKITVG